MTDRPEYAAPRLDPASADDSADQASPGQRPLSQLSDQIHLSEDWDSDATNEAIAETFYSGDE